MPGRGQLRREDRAMTSEESVTLLKRATEMRLATVDGEGWPYVVPLTFVFDGGKVFFHTSMEDSHLSANLETERRVCIEVDEPGPAFPTESTGCGVSRVFQSVIAFGRVKLLTGRKEKVRFFDGLLGKYADPDWGLTREYPRLDETRIFQIDIAVMTGKRRPGPE